MWRNAHADCPILAAAGAGAGSLIRHQTGAIIAVVAWGLVIELVVSATVTAVGPFLPYTAAAMMAGHPNESSPLGLRNLPFAIHVGADDSAYNRNKVAKEWGE